MTLFIYFILIYLLYRGKKKERKGKEKRKRRAKLTRYVKQPLPCHPIASNLIQPFIFQPFILHSSEVRWREETYSES